jgi:predicted nuclease of predicted toxin-antitoxin system
MKLLLDENLIPAFCDVLRGLGYNARHVYDVGLDQTPDEDIVAFAQSSGETILTNDLDFSRIIAQSGAEFPSVITFRLGAMNESRFQEIVLLNFPDLAEAALAGNLITIDEGGIRIRKLPLYK